MSILCRLGFHRCVPVPIKSGMMRRFYVRKLEACCRCGVVWCTRFNNGLAGGGRFRSGRVDPKTLQKEAK